MAIFYSPYLGQPIAPNAAEFYKKHIHSIDKPNSNISHREISFRAFNFNSDKATRIKIIFMRAKSLSESNYRQYLTATHNMPIHIGRQHFHSTLKLLMLSNLD